MREIEVLGKCENSVDEIIERLKDYKYVSKVRTIDTYYYDDLRPNLKPKENLRLTECFRIREKNDKTYMTYKVDQFTEDDIWLYSDEDETEVVDAKVVKKIIEHLGLKELIKIDNIKIKYENEDYEMYIEYVQNLGVFFEVEAKKDTNEEIEVIKNRIRAFIKGLKLTNFIELNEGKPEMMLKKLSK